jgi:enterochelin esterase-like enzyme
MSQERAEVQPAAHEDSELSSGGISDNIGPGFRMTIVRYWSRTTTALGTMSQNRYQAICVSAIACGLMLVMGCRTGDHRSVRPVSPDADRPPTSPLGPGQRSRVPVDAQPASTNAPAAVYQLGSDAESASSNVPGAPYPKIDSERHAEFRFSAPSATRVQLDIGGRKYDFTRDDEGMWSVVTPPLVVGFHYYAIVVDGASVADPASESFFGVSKMMSGIEVPSPGEDFYDAKDVSHGEVREHWYYSQTNSAWRRCFVYTPPDYDQNTTAHYPVVYLQHGAGEDERGWSTQGRVNFILDNLIAEGKAKPMIVVMDNGGGSALFAAPGRRPAGLKGGTNAPAGTNSPAMANTNRFARFFSGPAGRFPDTLLHEIIPMIDAAYRTIPDREHRALAGLSMGGMQTRMIGMAHLDTFANLGIFSGGTLGELNATHSPLANPAEFNRLVKVAFISYGSVERGAASLKSYHDSLVAAGITNLTCYISPDTAHEWQSWRRSFHQFAPLLFQNP